MSRLNVSSLWTKFFLAYAIIPIAEITGDSPYCHITCDYELHTMCLYSGRDDEKCNLPPKPLTADGKEEILQVHNEYRSLTAMGLLEVPLPMASNMKKMYWNDELAEIAQQWADQCTCQHDKCRKTLDETNVGQNLYFKTLASELSTNRHYDLKDWKGESKFANKELIINFDSSKAKGEVGDFTQMVWADSDEVGCARSMFRDTSSMTELIVCNYKQAGNFRNMSVYKAGMPCSGCECSKKYPGLCVKEGDMDYFGLGNKPTPMAGVMLILVVTQLCLKIFYDYDY